MRNILMIDIETTGTEPGCRVLTIGAFGFDKNGQQVEFYKRFDPLKLHAEGFQDSVSTMDWWTKKDKKVFVEAFGGTDDPAEGIGEFKRFCFQNFQMGKNDGFQVWCNGLDFDFPILKFFFNHYGFHFPWKFFDQYDYRTLKNIFPIIKGAEHNEDAHNALEDAKAQLRGLRDFFDRAERGQLT
jgi:hypothetical protein